MRAAEVGMRQWETQCAHVRTGRCQEWELREQEEVERGQPGAGTVGWAGPDFLGLVIVMTFWYVFGTDLTFFELFKLYFHSGLITTPYVFYDSFLFLCFILHTITWPGEVIIVL